MFLHLQTSAGNIKMDWIGIGTNNFMITMLLVLQACELTVTPRHGRFDPMSMLQLPSHFQPQTVKWCGSHDQTGILKQWKVDVLLILMYKRDWKACITQWAALWPDPLNKMFLEKLRVAQLFISCLRAWRFIPHSTAYHWNPNHINPVHTVTANLLKIKCNIILPSRLGFPIQFLCFQT